MPSEPPRFVPTLTEVVALPQEPVRADAARAPVAAAAQPTPPPAMPAPTPAPVSGPDELTLQQDLAEQIAHRVLQRIDAALEKRLADAIRAVVVRHTETLLPALREEIVMTVQDTVSEALAEEFLPTGNGAPGVSG